MTALGWGERSAFGRDPIGTYVCGRTHVVWCAAPDLVGIIQWGTPDERDVRDMIGRIDFDRHTTLAPRTAVLVDSSSVERIDPDGVLAFVALVREHFPRWSPRIARQAV